MRGCLPHHRPGLPDRQHWSLSGAGSRNASLHARTHLERLTSVVWVSVLIVNTWPPEAAHSVSSVMTRLLTGRTPNFITF